MEKLCNLANREFISFQKYSFYILVSLTNPSKQNFTIIGIKHLLIYAFACGFTIPHHNLHRFSYQTLPIIPITCAHKELLTIIINSRCHIKTMIRPIYRLSHSLNGFYVLIGIKIPPFIIVGVPKLRQIGWQTVQ